MKEEKLAKYKSILKDYWGYEHFRKSQLEVLESIGSHQHTLAILPTGGGKSICYQIPAIESNGLTIVISPLIALMIDQVNSLQKKGIPASALYGSLTKSQQAEIIKDALYGELKLLYISPERLTSKYFLQSLPQMNVRFIAIDEAHCISQWGHDFRPSYRNINSLKKIFPDALILAVTATATKQVQDDILEVLKINEASKVLFSSRRENLAYQVYRTDNKMGVILSIVKANPEQCGIIYARSRKMVAKICQYLKIRKIKAAAYHAGLSSEIKNKSQDDWIKDKIQIIVATNAFGMGIDKPDVRFVLHYDLAPNLEEYTQEAGRAGRDGRPCKAVILLDEKDIEDQKKNIEKAYPPEHLIRDCYKALASSFNLVIGETMQDAENFELVPFCKKYGLPLLPSFYALKLLDKTGYIMLSESFYHSASLKCYKEKIDDFYKTEENHIAKHLLDKVLRIYDGLFYKHVPINEKYLARKAELTEDETKKYLKLLAENEVLEYKAGGNNPRVKIRGPRLNSKHIKISTELYKKRKEDAYSKLKVLENYLNTKMCRQIIIDRYFGFDNAQKCGVCDHCIKSSNSKIDETFLQQKLISLLKKDITNIQDLMLQFNDNERDELIRQIEFLESNKVISIIADHLILER